MESWISPLMGRHHLLLLLSICFLVSPHATAVATCRPQDKAALLGFRRTFVKDSLAENDCNLYDWNEGVDCCSWDGITCQSSTGRVVRVNIFHSCSKGTSSSLSSLFRLSSLQDLLLGTFDLQRSAIPSGISKLTQLRRLVLSECNLAGVIPDAVGNLADLNELDLHSNSFSGSIPRSLANPKNLKILNLRDCGLTGTIPVALFSHPSLSGVDLSSNRLQGSFPSAIARPSRLTRLVLSNNTLSGRIPSWVFNIRSLQTLDLRRNSLGPLEPFRKPAATALDYVDLSFNKIGGQLPASLLQLGSVTTLNLADNQLAGAVEWNSFKNMVNLTSLTLSLNRGLTLKSTEAEQVKLPLFASLDVRSCSLTEFPEFLNAFTSFVYLDVSDNEIGGSVFKNGGWERLTVFNGSRNRIGSFQFPNEVIYSFDLSNNLIKGLLPKPPSSLFLLSLVNNQLSGDISPQFCNLTKLEVLDLGYNNLDGVLPRCLMNFSGELRVLSLQNNRFRGVIADSFGVVYDVVGNPVNQLEHLMLASNNFEGPLPRSLTACTNLKVLSLGNNQITDTFPSWLGQLPNLQILILGSNHFHGRIGAPATKDHFSNLQILDASSNSFSGPLPAALFQNLQYMKSLPESVDYVGGRSYIGNDGYYRFLITIDVTIKGIKLKKYNVLNTVKILDFSNNKFSGQIPAIINSLKALKVLTLSRNQLSGQIPPNIGNMSDLESLDLSRNTIRGRIPPSLRSLKHLEYLNLSFNNLQGTIPPGKFPSDSYIGNPRLCGPPLPKPCK